MPFPQTMRLAGYYSPTCLLLPSIFIFCLPLPCFSILCIYVMENMLWVMLTYLFLKLNPKHLLTIWNYNNTTLFLGVTIHGCNYSILEGWGRRTRVWGQRGLLSQFMVRLNYIARLILKNKKTVIILICFKRWESVARSSLNCAQVILQY